MKLNGIFGMSRNAKQLPLAVEFTSDGLAVCETSVFRNKYNSRVDLIRFGSKDTLEIKKELCEYFNKRNIKATTVQLNLPRHLVMAKTLIFPTLKDMEIKDMLAIEVAREMPFAEGDILSGHRIVNKRKDGYAEVLVAIAIQETVKERIDLLTACGIAVEKIAVSSESLFAWYTAKGGVYPPERTTAIVSVMPDYVDMAVAQGNRLLFTRAFPWNAGPFERENEAAENLIAALSLYTKEKGRLPDRIILTGNADRLPGLAANLKRNSGVECEIIPEEFACLVGLSQGSKNIAIDLLPEKFKKTNELRKIKRYGAIGAALACSSLVLLLLAGGKDVMDKTRYLNGLEAQLRALSPMAMEARRIFASMKIAREGAGNMPFAVEMLSAIYRLTPSGITFSMVDLEPNGVMTFRGSAPSLDDTVKFMQALDSSKCFRNAKLQYTSQRNNAEKQGTDFEISCMAKV